MLKMGRVCQNEDILCLRLAHTFDCEIIFLHWLKQVGNDFSLEHFCVMSVWSGVGRSALISCGSLLAGDAIIQGVEIHRGELSEWSYSRSARFAMVGFTLHGPFFHAGFGQVDRLWGSSRTFKIAMAKMITSQVTLFPTFLALLFPYLSLLEGKTPEQAIEKTKRVWWPTFRNGAVFWPAVNLFNFLVVPPGPTRVLFVSSAAIVWNCYISLVNHDEQPHQLHPKE